MKTLSEMQYGMRTEGLKAKMPQLEGALLTILGVGFFDSEFAPGACVQCEQGEKKVWFLSYSEMVVKTLEDHQGQEPYTATLISHKSGTDRTYWTLE